MTPRDLPAIEVVLKERSFASRMQIAKLNLRDSLVAHLRALVKRRDWQAVTIRPALTDASLVLVMVIRNELPRLAFFLDYYRRLGVEHFLVVDNQSSDDTLEFLRNHDDVSIVLAVGSYGDSRYGVDWLNGVLRRFCIGKWVLWVDADELLVFSDHADVKVLDLTAVLEAAQLPSMQAIMIDMYSNRAPSQNLVVSGQSPLVVCTLFDGGGYRQTFSAANHTAWVKGGVRERVFFDDPSAAPALNKTPLVRWRRHYVYLKSAHQIWPRRVNGRTRLGGALLHFKFTDVAASKMTDPANRGQHTAEYDAYEGVDERTMVGDLTETYVSAGQLNRLGIIEPFL